MGKKINLKDLLDSESEIIKKIGQEIEQSDDGSIQFRHLSGARHTSSGSHKSGHSSSGRHSSTTTAKIEKPIKSK